MNTERASLTNRRSTRAVTYDFDFRNMCRVNGLFQENQLRSLPGRNAQGQNLGYLEMADGAVVVIVGPFGYDGRVVMMRAMAEVLSIQDAEYLVRVFYVVMVKFVAPILVLAILVSEICRTLGIGGWKI